jgi:4-amino-4-deoxy-L-arabinose transferase-like glycosyltransferase
LRDAHADSVAESGRAKFSAEIRRRQIILTAGSFLIVAALGGLIFFYNLGAYGLWEPDEARYAEIAREMIVTHNFVVPHLNYVAYVEKPPLLYWLTAASMRVLGVNQFAARLPNALAAILGLFATFFFTFKVFDRRRALMAGVILATSGLYAVMAQVLTTDMLLTAAITVAIFALYLHWREGGRWCWVMYVAVALGILTKGPVAAAIPLIVGLVFLWWERDFKGWVRRFHLIGGIILVLVLATPWFAALSLKVPGYFDFYFIGENIRRFLQPGYSHTEPIYYYVPVILLGALPWTLTVPLIRWRQLSPNPARRFCLIAVGVVFVFFSLAHAKLSPYIMPALPPLAVVLADGLMRFDEESGFSSARSILSPDIRRLAIIGAVVGIAGVATLEVSLHAADFRTPYVMQVRPALDAAAAIAIIAGLVCWMAFWWRRLKIGLAIIVIASASLFVVGSYGRLMATPLRSYAALVRAIQARAPNATLVCYPRYLQSLPFYTGRRVVLVGDPTELSFGAAHASDADQYFFKNQASLLRLWRQPRPTVLVLDRSVFPGLSSKLGDYTVIAVDRKKIAVMRKLPAGVSPRTGSSDNH